MSDPIIPFLAERDHPLRRALTEEMHVRRFPALTAPLRMTQLVMLTGEERIDALGADAAALFDAYGVKVPPKARYFTAQIGELHLVWEQHTEFSTYSFARTGAFDDPFGEPTLADVPADWLDAMPGRVLRATQVSFLGRGAPPPVEADLRRWFSYDELVCCDVFGGEARIWSDFHLGPDGLGRLLIQDQGLASGADTGRLVQRLQELGNYRNMALLGLPVAQSLTPTLSALERRLAELSRQIAERDGSEDTLLHELSSLSAELAQLMAETRYRMSATRAYAQLVQDRARNLGVHRVAGFQTLIDFTERRLTPAVRTCESFSQRAEDLSERASWASSLLRARIETTLERQSTELLQSMNRRAQMQLRLQQTVEGLSVLAISYYAIGILGYATKSANHVWPWIDPTLPLGIAAPFVVAAVWYSIRRLRKKMSD
ncbi:MAG TPA: DUF3422 domain-containing protein [Steroidobacteraceae bacterium]|nr:DUF3422 domain-containing protein [Steroidobacteraceae bacterium]